MTETLPATPEGIARAAALLRGGAPVAFPTETVYGLGGDARSDAAVAAIYAAKGRPAFNPLIVHVGSLAEARGLARFDDRALALAAAFWPGPMTLVLPLRAGAGLAGAVTAGLDTVAIRVPAHPVAREVLAAFGGPLAAPSANPSGRVSPTTAAHVAQGLGGRIAAVLDGGACAVGVESTILASRDGAVHLLRPGGLAVEAVEVLLGSPVITAQDPATPQAPGQLPSHYAPAARVRLNARSPAPGEVWIAFGADAPLTLSPTADLAQAAARLFAVLRQADGLAGRGGTIAVAPVPDTGLGRAINDRLRRAAAPREG